MADDLIKRLNDGHAVLKSGDIDACDLKRAWCAMADAVAEIQRLRALVDRTVDDGR